MWAVYMSELFVICFVSINRLLDLRDFPEQVLKVALKFVDITLMPDFTVTLKLYLPYSL